jgi:hypothetical protein
MNDHQPRIFAKLTHVVLLRLKQRGSSSWLIERERAPSPKALTNYCRILKRFLGDKNKVKWESEEVKNKEKILTKITFSIKNWQPEINDTKG